MRINSLPEGALFKDKGCDYHPECLSCPLPVCRHDLPGGLQSALNLQRDVEVRKLRRMGAKVIEIAEMVGCSERTVVRASQGLTLPRLRPIGRDRSYDTKDVIAAAKQILVVTAITYGVTVDDIKGPKRDRLTTDARFAAEKEMRDELNMTVTGIGLLVKRDHSAVLYGIRRAGGESPRDIAEHRRKKR